MLSKLIAATILNKTLKNIDKKMDNPEKLTTQGAKKTQHNCGGHHHTQKKNTNNVIKT